MLLSRVVALPLAGVVLRLGTQPEATHLAERMTRKKLRAPSAATICACQESAGSMPRFQLSTPPSSERAPKESYQTSIPSASRRLTSHAPNSLSALEG